MGNSARPITYNRRTDGSCSTSVNKEGLVRLALLACAFGLAMAWLQFSYNASNFQFEFASAMPWVFKQAARVAIVVALLCYPRFAARPAAGKVGLAACSIAAAVCVVLTTVVSIGREPSVPLASACGLLCGAAFVVPLAKWMASSMGSSFAFLFLSVSLGAIVTGVLSWTVSLLPADAAAWVSLAFPLGSMALLLLLEKRPSSVSLLPDVVRPRQNPMYFVSMAIAGGLVWSIFVDNWMPDIELSFLWFFMPCGLMTSVMVLAVAKMRVASEIVFALLVAASSVISLLALSPFFANAVFYSAIFMSAWSLLLFALAGSIWYGSACGDRGLKIACFSVALVYLTQLLIRFVTLLFPPHDVTLLVTSVVLLVLSLVILLIAQMRNQAQQSTDGHGAMSEDNRIDGMVREYGLTEREADVLRLLAKGNSVKGIAEKLLVSENTVKFHRGNIYQKLGISSRQKLIDMIGERDGSA